MEPGEPWVPARRMAPHSSHLRRSGFLGLLFTLPLGACVGTQPPVALPETHAHRCVEAVEGLSTSWDRLQNPILSLEDAAVKDVSVRAVNGRWELFYSDIVDHPFRVRVGRASSPDLIDWTVHPEVWDDPAVGGFASPDMTRLADGRYAVTFNSHTRDLGDAQPKLYMRTSADLETWTEPERLAPEMNGKRGDRLIDAAFAHVDGGFLLAFKKGQSPRLGYAATLEGPWRELGRPVVDGVPIQRAENTQFLQIDGVWHMLVTTIPAHDPKLYALSGEPERPEDWLYWTELGKLSVPKEVWNQKERANAAYLCDARPLDGHFYLFYAGSNELKRFEGRGHAKIAVARSMDLVNWSAPGSPMVQNPSIPRPGAPGAPQVASAEQP